MKEKLEKLLIKHEGMILKPYVCPAGYYTIGVGRNLEANGVSKDEALFMLRNDIERCQKQASEFSWFKMLDDTRQDVVVSMIFNMGLRRFKGFVKMIDALKNADFHRAAAEMMSSRWSQQVGKRAIELSDMMRFGNYEAVIE